MKPSTLRVLHALLTAGDHGATTHDLCQPNVGGIRFGGRIHELRELGYVIEARPERPGSHRYTLKGAGRRAA